jgi:hypothetical protein
LALLPTTPIIVVVAYNADMYEDVILLTLQLLYYRSWVSRIKYTHVKAGTF